MQLKLLFCLIIILLEFQFVKVEKTTNTNTKEVEDSKDKQGENWAIKSHSRSKLVQERCQKLKYFKEHGPKLSNEVRCEMIDCPIYVGKNPKFMYCNVPKVGSTTLKTEMVNNLGLTTKHVHNGKRIRMLRVAPLTFSSERRSEYLKYMFVRHPFARLVSFFNNKMDSALPKFLKSVGELTDKNEISFKNFVEVLLRTRVSKYGRHFIPYTRLCLPCQVNYDFIGKIEDFDQDRSTVYKDLGFKISKEMHLNARNSSDNTEFLFSQLTRNQVKKLYKKYIYDFELFNYSPEPYLAYASS